MSVIAHKAPSSVRLLPSDEQQVICDGVAYAPPPPDKSSRPKQCPHLVRVTAGAGTGKTTALLEVAKCGIHRGHTRLTYLTFNRSAAEDGKRRIYQAIASDPAMDSTKIEVEARTLHSCAMKLLDDQDEVEEEGGDDDNDDDDDIDRLGTGNATTTRGGKQEDKQHSPIINENSLVRRIERICEQDIESYLQPCYRQLESQPNSEKNLEQRRKRARKKVVFFIVKTFTQFCRSHLNYNDYFVAEGKKNSYLREYFPATLFHKTLQLGFLPERYALTALPSFYNRQAKNAWDTLTQNDVRTFDMELKRAQLKLCRIPGSLLLVDESQDLDACQVDWITQQCTLYHSHVYLVGDAAQTIYSFRGAKSKFMTELPTLQPSFVRRCVVNHYLTKSWRFGPEIARVANLVLYVKTKSPQTNSAKPMWKPYTLVGASQVEGRVTARPITHLWKEQQITILSFTNATLLNEALNILGVTPASLLNASEADGEDDQMDLEQPKKSKETTQTEMPLPKFCINGKGAQSGLGKWKKVLKEIDFLFELYTKGEASLPTNFFPEFYGETLTWKGFLQECQEREINKYAAVIGVIQNFKDRAREAMDIFKREVMDKSHTPDEADVILSTCHAAKGMEWDSVQVCDDFSDVNAVNRWGPTPTSNNGKLPSTEERSRGSPSWQFALKNYGDDVNLLYVACTRAKKLLSIPQSLVQLICDLDAISDYVRSESEEPFTTLRSEAPARHVNEASEYVLGLKAQKILTKQEARSLFTDLIEPIQKFCGIDPCGTLLKAMLQDDHVDTEGERDGADVAVTSPSHQTKQRPTPSMSAAETPSRPTETLLDKAMLSRTESFDANFASIAPHAVASSPMEIVPSSPMNGMLPIASSSDGEIQSPKSRITKRPHGMHALTEYFPKASSVPDTRRTLSQGNRRASSLVAGAAVSQRDETNRRVSSVGEVESTERSLPEQKRVVRSLAEGLARASLPSNNIELGVSPSSGDVKRLKRTHTQ